MFRKIEFDDVHPVKCPVCGSVLMSVDSEEPPNPCKHVIAWYSDFDEGGWCCDVSPWVKNEIKRFRGMKKDAALARIFEKNPCVEVHQTTYYVGGGVSATETIAFSMDGSVFITDEKEEH